MKKILFLLVMVFNLTAYAADVDAINCPESVTCTRAGDSKSCTIKTDHPENWQTYFGLPGADKNVFAGTHKLSKVESRKRSRNFGNAACYYPTTDTSANIYIAISAYKLADLHVVTDSGLWKFPNKFSPDSGVCNSANTQLCPLTRHSALIVHNKNIRNRLLVSANDVRVPLDKPIDEGQDVKIMYDDVLAGCRDADVCRIDITTLEGGIYGYVYVDMTKRMNILSAHSWRPSEVDIKQIDSFNAVEVAYTYR